MDRPGAGAGLGGAAGALASFMKIGLIGIVIFSLMHLSSCYFLSWIIGHDFSTVVYVTAAAIVTGTLVTFTIAFLVTLNILLTAVTGFFGRGSGENAAPFNFPSAPRQRERHPERIPPAPTTSSNRQHEQHDHGMKLD